MYGFTISLAGAPIVAECGKLKNTGFGTPAVEFMALANAIGTPVLTEFTLPSVSRSKENDDPDHQDAIDMLAKRWACSSVMWMRQLLKEIGFDALVKEPTSVYTDSKGAISWINFRKINPSNHYILIAYHQAREWVASKDIEVKYIRTNFNIADLLTKSISKEVIKILLMKFLGYIKSIPGQSIDNTQVVQDWMKSLPSINQMFDDWKLE